MSTAPGFAATPHVASVAISTANTNRDGTGTIATLFTAGSAGSKIERVRVKATATTTAGMVRAFLYDGSTYYLFDEYNINAVTPSGTVAGFVIETTYRDLVLASGWSLRVSTNNAEAFEVHAFGGDY